MMNFMDREAIPGALKDAYYRAVHPMVQYLARRNMHPNTLTTLGFLVSGVSAVVMARGHFRIAGVLVLLAGLFDTVDGKLARDSGKVSRFGALFDSTLDRYSEVLLFFGMAYYYIQHDLYLSSIVTAVALGGSLMVSYIRARAEGLGFECKVGILQRPERLLLIAGGCLIHARALSVAVWIIAVLSNYTALVRILHVWREDRAAGAPAAE